MATGDETVTSLDFKTQLQTVLGTDISIPAFETFFLITSGATMQVINDKEGNGKTIYCFDHKPQGENTHEQTLATVHMTTEGATRRIQIAGIQKHSDLDSHIVTTSYESEAGGDLNLTQIGFGAYHESGRDTVFPRSLPFLSDEFAGHLKPIAENEAPCTKAMVDHTKNPFDTHDNTIFVIKNTPDDIMALNKYQIEVSQSGGNMKVEQKFTAPFSTITTKMPSFQVPINLSSRQ